MGKTEDVSSRLASLHDMVQFWKGRHVLVTGGSGFVGSHLVTRLEDLGAHVIAPNASAFDLTRAGSVSYMFGSLRTDPDIVFHLAATVGGIGANMRLPATFLYDNATMNINVAREALNANVRKFVAVGSVCAYPEICPVPFKEESIFDGYPEPTNAPYGLTKRLLLVYLQAMRAQYGFNGVMLFPTNLYGPGDHFEAGAHVIPTLLRRFHRAKMREETRVKVWGTGKATRDFLFVSDAVSALEMCARTYNRREPINIGTGVEVSILDLAYAIAEIVGYDQEFVFDKSRPDGQPRRCLDIARARELLGWEPKINLDFGLRTTYDWWKESTAETK